MALTRETLVAAALLLPAGLLIEAARAADPGPEMARLEQAVFQRRLSPEDAARLLGELERADQRKAAAQRLAAEGQGHVDAVVAFARRSLDPEARQACADVVEALDAAYRTTDAGKQLGALYREHTEELWAAAWAAFRKDPLDPRAVAVLMHADPDKVYAALGKSPDRYDRLRFLLLRVRELTPDRFAADRLFEHTHAGAVRVLGDVFSGAPARGGGDGFHRVVGQTLLKYVEVRKKFGDTPGLPPMEMVCYEGRRVFLYRVYGTATAAHLSLVRHTYSPSNLGRAEATFLPDTTGPWYQSIEAVPLATLPGVKIDRDKAVRANYPWAKQFLPEAYRQFGNWGPGWQGDPPELVPVQAMAAEKPGPETAEKPPAPPEPAPPAPRTPEERAEARKKAEAALAAARALTVPGDDGRLATWRAKLPGIEEAARLDPTWDAPARERVHALGMTAFYSLSTRNPDIDACQRTLDAAEDYFRRFPDVAEDRGKVYDSVRIAVHVVFVNLHTGQPQEMDDRRAKMLDAAARLADHAFAHAARRLGQDYSELMPNVIYRGMRLRGVPVEQREAWLDANLKRCADRVEAVKKTGNYDDVEGAVEDYELLQCRAAALAAEDGRLDRARALMNDLQARIDRGERMYSTTPERMRNVWKALDDAEGLAAFERWLKERSSREVVPLRIAWPAVEVLAEERWEQSTIHVLTPRVHATVVRFKAIAGLSTPIRPLAEGDGRLYVALGRWDKRLLGYLPLDALGRPVGQTYFVHQPVGADLWDSLQALPPPPANVEVKMARYLGGKLYVAGGKSGILAFDPKTRAWTHYPIGSPLPGKSVDTVYLLDDHTLFSIDAEFRNPLCYVLDLQEGKVSAEQRLTDQWVNRVPKCLWRDDGKLLGFSEGGLAEGLPAEKPKFTPFPSQGIYGWTFPPYRNIRGMVELGTRRFLCDEDGLHEFDAAGRIVRSWHGGRPKSPGGDDNYRNPAIGFPPDSPAFTWGASGVAATDGMIYFVGRSFGSAVLGFDPAQDTWYGPLRVERGPGEGTLFATRGALWLGTDDGLLHVDAAEFARRARETGRVMTTEEFRQKRDAIIQSRPPLERAKLAFAMRRLDEAKGLLDALLATDPGQPEALLLSAFLYERWCRDQPDEAIRYYRRLADIEDNPGASAAGMLAWLDVLVRRHEWQAASDLCARIRAEHPRLAQHAERDVSYLQAYVRKKLAGEPDEPE